MHKASIIIPYYKKKKFINRTLNSVLKQTYQNFEIIIVYDDKDKSELRYVKNFQKLDKRIKIIINKKNYGAGISRNIGINKSKGSFICLIDADDFWKKNKLKTQIRFMLENKYLISHTSYEIVDSKDKVIGVRKARNFQTINDLIFSCDIGLSTVIFNKKIFSKNIKFVKIKTKEDFVMWLNILKKGISIYALNKKLTKWTKSKVSLSSSITQKLSDSYLVYNNYMKFGFLKSIYYTIILSLNYLKKAIFNS